MTPTIKPYSKITIEASIPIKGHIHREAFGDCFICAMKDETNEIPIMLLKGEKIDLFALAIMGLTRLMTEDENGNALADFQTKELKEEFIDLLEQGLDIRKKQLTVCFTARSVCFTARSVCCTERSLCCTERSVEPYRASQHICPTTKLPQRNIITSSLPSSHHQTKTT